MTDEPTYIKGGPAMSVQPRPFWEKMPNPPKGTVWVLSLDLNRDDATLWLYKRNRLTGAATPESVALKIVHELFSPPWQHLSIDKSSTEAIVKAVMATAHEMVDHQSTEPERRSEREAQAAELSRRLGIKVEVRR